MMSLKIFLQKNLERIKNNFPKLGFIITGDAPYASGPFIKLCLDNKWDYIFRLKSDELQTVNRDFEGIIKIDSGCNINNYFLVNDYFYNKYKLNIVRYTEKAPLILTNKIKFLPT